VKPATSIEEMLPCGTAEAVRFQSAEFPLDYANPIFGPNLFLGNNSQLR
jgi:hypothetical protein